MTEPRFEHDLLRMFADVPPASDADLFALRVRERLDRSWAWRRTAVGVAGAAAGAFALWQLGGAQVLGRLSEAMRSPLDDMWRRTPGLSQAAQVLHQTPAPPELVWLLGGLALLAAGFLATRVADEF